MKSTFIQLMQKDFFGSFCLLSAAFIAMLIANSPWQNTYTLLLHQPMAFGFFHLSILSFINDGLMTLFFLMVGAELKRECLVGSLQSRSQILLPTVAAIGGMVVPAVIYVAINRGAGPALQGWATPVATDIAFAVGVLNLFGKRVPNALKIFLLTLAIVDDLGAILIIACAQPQKLVWGYVLLTLLLVAALMLLQRTYGFQRRVFGIACLILWGLILSAGLQPTLAGVLIAFLIPLNTPTTSPLVKLEQSLHKPISFVVMPLFALANAGVAIEFHALHLTHNVLFGVMFGLCLGKPIGVMFSSWLMIRIGVARMPLNVSWLSLLGVAFLCGIGFTMSLFLGTLAFPESPAYLAQARLGIILGSIFATVFGSMVLKHVFRAR